MGAHNTSTFTSIGTLNGIGGLVYSAPCALGSIRGAFHLEYSATYDWIKGNGLSCLFLMEATQTFISTSLRFLKESVTFILKPFPKTKVKLLTWGER